MIVGKDLEFAQFVIALSGYGPGHQTGRFDGRRYAVTIERPLGGRVTKLFAEELGGSDFVSFNLYDVEGEQPLLKPCEMASDKVIDFVMRFEPDRSDRAAEG